MSGTAGAASAVLNSAMNTAAGAEAVGTSLFEAFFVQRQAETGELELLGTGIIWLLLLLSAVSLGLIGSVAIANRRSTIMPDELYDRVRACLEGNDHAGAESAVAEDPSFFATIMSAALWDARAGFNAMVRALEQTSEELTLRRLRRVEPLNVVGQVSPMIGLFGTVYGMILAFRVIVQSGGTPDPVGLAAGIGTALTTTFWGLVVAIPSLAGYALLRNRIDALTIEATREAEELINRFRPGAAGDAGARDTPMTDRPEAARAAAPAGGVLRRKVRRKKGASSSGERGSGRRG